MRRKRKWFLRIDFGRHFRFQASDRVTIFILQDGDRTKISICFRVKNEENMFKFKGKTLIFSSNSIIKRFYNVWGVSISKGFLFAWGKSGLKAIFLAQVSIFLRWFLSSIWDWRMNIRSMALIFSGIILKLYKSRGLFTDFPKNSNFLRYKKKFGPR